MTLSQVRRVFPNLPFLTYIMAIEKAAHRCESILDIGCGRNSPIRLFSRKVHMEGVDGYEPYLRESEMQGIHARYHLLDIRQIGERFAPKSFDCVMALDVIEHLDKQDGLGLISSMETIARKRTIIFTPNSFIAQSEYDDNDMQQHLSGWTTTEMRQLGYKVKGMFGLKFFRSGKAELKFRPKLVWGLLSEISHWLYAHHRPEAAFSLFCVKDLSR